MTAKDSRRSSPSAHDVARLAGVSQAAVSRAFTPGASIAEATRGKVLQAAESLGYRPNLLARSLIKGESGIIGVVAGDLSDQNIGSTLDVLCTRLAEADKHILMFTVQENVHADKQVEDLLKYRVDALLLMETSLSTKLAERCHKEGIPVIFFNRQFGRTRKFTTVVGNNRKGARQIAEHLLQQGYRRLALIAGSERSPTTRDRESAFTDYLAKRGLPRPLREVGLCRRDATIEAARRLLSRKDRPDAIFCANDYMALAAIEVARYEFGLEIGREIGIAGFDDLEQASWPSFDLTTCAYPMDAMIEKVMRLLLPRPDLERPVHHLIDCVLKTRGSTQRSRK